jgi:phage portal protein BeeE
MGLFDIFKKKSIVLQQSSAQPANLIFRMMGANPVIFFADDTDTYLRKGFEGNHVIFTVADWAARKMTLVPPILYNTKDKGAAKDYQALRKEGSHTNYIEALRIKNKAFTEVKDHPLLDVLKNPNPTMTWDEFVYGFYIYKKFVGRSVIQGIATNEGLNAKKMQELWLLPANYIQAVSGSGLNIIDYYQDSRNPAEKIPTEQIMIARNFSSNYTVAGSHLSGQSVMQAARGLLTKSNAALEAESESLQNRGARTLVFPTVPKELIGAAITMPDGETVDSMNVALNKRLREAGNQGVVVNSLPLGVAQIGLSPVDLQILETNKMDIQAWCSLFHVDSRVVFNDHQSSTKDNMQQARLNCITDGVLPELEALKNCLNSSFVKSWGEGLMLDFDYTVLPEIQKELRDTAKEMKDTEAFTINEIRDMWKFGEYAGENGDKILVSSSKTILDDLSNTLPDANVSAGY